MEITGNSCTNITKQSSINTGKYRVSTVRTEAEFKTQLTEITTEFRLNHVKAGYVYIRSMLVIMKPLLQPLHHYYDVSASTQHFWLEAANHQLDNSWPGTHRQGCGGGNKNKPRRFASYHGEIVRPSR